MKISLALKKTNPFWCGLWLCLCVLGTFPFGAKAEPVYSGLIGGLGNGSQSLGALGFKIGFARNSGWELTYGRAAVKLGEHYLEKEYVYALQYRGVSKLKLVNIFLGAGIGGATSESRARNLKQSVTNFSFVLSTGLDWYVTKGFGFKAGIDNFLVVLPRFSPLATIGERNLWYVGLMLDF